MSTPGVVSPKLSDEEKTQAIDILNRDPELTAALDGTQFTVENIGPWTSERRIIGVAVSIQLASEKDIAMNWRYVKFIGFEGDRPVYERLSHKGRAFGVTQMQALIDLNSQEVVSLSATLLKSMSYEGASGETTRPDDPRNQQVD